MCRSLGETANGGHDADRGDRDGLAADGHAGRFRENPRRLDHAVVVEHRFAHAHENDAAHRIGRVGLNLDHLVDDFPRGQIAAEPHPAGGTKRAPHRAAHLRTDAHHIFKVIRPVQERNADRLERFGSIAAKKIFGKPVLRRDRLVDQRQVRNGRQAANLVQQFGGDAFIGRRKRAASHGRRMNLPRLTRRQADARQVLRATGRR